VSLEPQSVWTDTLLRLQPTPSAQVGLQQFADWVGDRSDLVQAGSAGSPLFTFNRPVFIAQLRALGFTPTRTNNWIPKVATAWENAVKASTIKRATTPDPVWTISVVDVITIPIASATILTIPAGKAILTAGLTSASQGFTAIKQDTAIRGRIDQFSKAFRDATLAFTFLLIGIRLVGIVPVPFPKVFPAS
jgi:hypothetical protein